MKVSLRRDRTKVICFALLGAGLAGACPTSKIVLAESAAIREQKD